MGGPVELLEHMEHVSHAGHGGGEGHGPAGGASTAKHIGISMACLGVLLAFCSALVGGTRTELVKTMVEQTTAQAKYQAQSIKYRVVVTQLQALVAGVPRPAELAAADASLAKLEQDAASGATPSASSAGLRVATRQIVDLLAPSKESLVASAALVHKYRLERDAASEWIESFDPAIRAHTEAGEHYEWAQLCAEVGIVVASIALLFASRKVWAVALVLGASAIGILGWTYATTHEELAHAEHRIEETGTKYRELRKAQDEKASDEELVASVEARYGGAPAAKTAAKE